MLHASTQKLIVKLCELTEAREIAWKEGVQETCVFESEGYTVEVRGSPPTVRLLGSDGRELERVDEAELASQPWPGGDGTFASHVVILASEAGRVARGAEIAISRILSSLSASPKNAVSAPSALLYEQAPVSEAHSLEEAETAIERVLAVQPGAASPPDPSPEMPAAAAEAREVEAAIEQAEASAEAELQAQSLAMPAAELAPEPVPAEVETIAAVEPVPAALAVVAEPEHAPQPAEPESPPEPVFATSDVLAAAAPEPEITPPIDETPAFEPSRRQTAFGATPSFARTERPEPKPAEAPPPAPNLVLQGLVATVRPLRVEPLPQPAPPPAAKPAQAPVAAPDRTPEPAGADPDIYKPWS